MGGRGRGARSKYDTSRGMPGHSPAQRPEPESVSVDGLSEPNQTLPPTVTHNCGMCGHQVGDDAIGCDKCTNWVHPTEMCSGLPREAISTIASLSGDAVLFVCTSCRAKPSGSGVSTRQGGANNSSEQLFHQLFLSVKAICSAVMDLTARMDRVFSGSQAPAPPQLPLHLLNPNLPLCLPTLVLRTTQMNTDLSSARR